MITTRSDQKKDRALKARGEKAAGCDLFLSIHSNATGSGMNESIDYPAVYHLTEDSTTTADDVSMEVAAILAPIIAGVMQTKQAGKVLSRVASSDRNGDGIMNDNYYGVLNGARSVNVPGLILEHSFHTNSRAVNWLLNEENLERLAIAESGAIAEYFGLKKGSEELPEEELSKLYRVQVGAFSKKENAEKMLQKVKAAGFDTYIAHNGVYYKVQVGAYQNKANAEKMLQKVKAAGFDTYITTEGGNGISSVVKKTVQEIAKEVIAGKWGNGETRKQKLTDAGYDPKEIQKEVNELLK